jgi:putative aldouronate transport system permease protein
MNRLDKSEIVFKILSYVLLTAFALMCLYPFLFLVANAFSQKEFVDNAQVSIFPIGFQVDAFVTVLSQEQFWVSYCNSLFITIYGTLVSMLVAITGAYALSKTRLLFHRGFNFMLVFTMWFSAGMIPTLNNFISFGVDNNKYMFIVALGFNAFNIILLRNYFSSVPTEIEEAATIDGATEFQILTKVYIPMSKSSIATVAMFYAVSRWNGYIWAQMLLSDPADMPLQVFIRQEMQDFIDEMEQATTSIDLPYSIFSVQYALIICSILPIVIIYPKISKYFAAGVNVGGVKE